MNSTAHFFLEAIRAQLDASGHPWTADVDGRFMRVKLAGHIVAILPAYSHVRPKAAALKNVEAKIRRTVRSLKK